MVDVVQSVRTSDCGSEGRRFEPDLPPSLQKRMCLFERIFFFMCFPFVLLALNSPLRSLAEGLRGRAWAVFPPWKCLSLGKLVGNSKCSLSRQGVLMEWFGTRRSILMGAQFFYWCFYSFNNLGFVWYMGCILLLFGELAAINGTLLCHILLGRCHCVTWKQSCLLYKAAVASVLLQCF